METILQNAEIEQHVRAVPDFPKPGVLFRDIAPLLGQPAAFASAVDRMAAPLSAHGIEGLVAIESRGFLFGSAMARALALPLVIVRKPGKLPGATRSVTYALEYGTDRLEIQSDAIRAAARYAIIDDVLATGGTAAAAAELVRSAGGEIGCLSVLIELAALGGRARLEQSRLPVECVLRY